MLSFRQVSDINEDLAVPDEYAETVMGSNLWWRILVAGAGAGAGDYTYTNMFIFVIRYFMVD